MDYALIGKIEKAKMYASEPERIQFDDFSVRLLGDNESVHHVQFKEGKWQCGCLFFKTRGFCSHTMTMERVLGDMITQPVTA